MITNRTFTMLKPDSLEKGNTGAILHKINASGFKIVAMKQTQMSRRDAETFYAIHSERPFFADLVQYMTRGPIVATRPCGAELTACGTGLRPSAVPGSTRPGMEVTGTASRSWSCPVHSRS